MEQGARKQGMGQPEKEWNKTNTAYNSTMEENCFRFQDKQICQRAAAFSPELFQLADQLEKQRLFRFAEQSRGAVLSITNNIAEGSGITSRLISRIF
jgi:hypothetical protein